MIPGSRSTCPDPFLETVSARNSPSAVMDRDMRRVWPLVYISVTWIMHIGMDSEEKDEGGFRDSHTFKHQYLIKIWIERLLIKFLVNLSFPPFFSPVAFV